jgi:hypothetical protein
MKATNLFSIHGSKGGTWRPLIMRERQLIRVVENYKNVVLPSKLIYEIYKKFPDGKL